MAYDHKKFREEVDTYIDTVWATVAFAHECKWDEANRCIDPSVKIGLGRPMMRPDKKEVTPDLVIQRRPNRGTTAEVKHTFPPSGAVERRQEIFTQLKSYDADLLGWWTASKKIEEHDIVLLTHHSHVIDAVDYGTKELAGKE